MTALGIPLGACAPLGPARSLGGSKLSCLGPWKLDSEWSCGISKFGHSGCRCALTASWSLCNAAQSSSNSSAIFSIDGPIAGGVGDFGPGSIPWAAKAVWMARLVVSSWRSAEVRSVSFLLQFPLLLSIFCLRSSAHRGHQWLDFWSGPALCAAMVLEPFVPPWSSPRCQSGSGWSRLFVRKLQQWSWPVVRAAPPGIWQHQGLNCIPAIDLLVPVPGLPAPLSN